MSREIIFGVFDKTTGCGNYTGYFKYEDGAKKELKSQMNHLQQEHGLKDLILKNDRVVSIEEQIETIYLIIHPIVLR